MKVRLRNIRDNKIVNIYNTHLYWSPYYEPIKVLQTMILQCIVHREIKSNDELVFVVGDMNSHPDSNVVRILSHSLRNEYEVRINHNNIQYL